MRTQESDVLLRKKTLGVRRVRSLVPAAFSPVSPPKDESSDPKVPESPQETFESDFVSRIVYLQCTSVTNCAGSVGRRGHRRRGSAAHMRRQHAVQTPPRAPARGCAVYVWLCDGFPGFSGKRLYSSRRHGPWQDFAGCYSFVDVAYSGHHRPVNMPPWPRRVSHISRTLPTVFCLFVQIHVVIISSCLCSGDKLGKRIHQVHTRLHHGNNFFDFAAAQFLHSPLLALPLLHDEIVLMLDVTLPQVAARPHERAGLQRVYQRQSHIHHRLLPALNTSSSRSRY